MAEIKDEQQKEELEIIPLYDRIKIDIYDFFCELTDLRDKILIDRAEGYEPKHLLKFKAKLVSFYGFIRTKIDYPKGKEYSKLKELKEFVTRPEDITDQQAERYYILFSKLMERLGISKIGRVSMTDPLKAPFEKGERG